MKIISNCFGVVFACLAFTSVAIGMYSCDSSAGDQACYRGIYVVSCPSGPDNCERRCLYEEIDTSNCGSCGTQCAEGDTCADDQRHSQCAQNEQFCNGSCVDVDSDEGNCGSCSQSCSDGQVCARGRCADDCPPGLTQCGGSCVDDMSDPTN